MKAGCRLEIKEDITMTIRKMRQLLTAVEDQEMTIRQLRKILFDMEDQDQEA